MTDYNDIVNYIVTRYSFDGKIVIVCNTVEQAWEAIGNRLIYELYEVTSPTGKNTTEFTPF